MRNAWQFAVVFATVPLLSASGCGRVAKVRQRLAQHDSTVPSAELLLPDAGARSELGRSRSARHPRSDLLSRLSQRSSTWQPIGQSVEGRSIEAIQFGRGPTRVLLIGGIHGDEPEGQPLVERLAQELQSNRSLSRGATILLLGDLNPDGTAARTRGNKNGVDLNRNFPASNWDSTARQPRFNPGPQPSSEPETQLMVELLREFQPHRILVMHATRGKPMVNYDGPARQLAESLSQLNGYVTSDTIGYPTPGSLGSYAGIDMQIPIITLELPRGIATEQAWQANREALHIFVR